MKYSLIYLFLFLAGTCLVAQSQMDFPKDDWKAYKNVADAGYSAAKLDAAKTLFENSQAAGLLIVHRGRVLASWGETTRRFMCASIRKSFMNALIGIAAEKGKMDLDKSLAQLNIDDIGQLTAIEKGATVKQLLAARSGVYHAAAFSPRNMARNLPARGSHKPGDFWFYNNWDFNTLVTIFEQETGQRVFPTFQKWIAEPLRLSDFSLDHTYYCHEPDKSAHPAYLFRMSARDMARFGHLFLNNGRWEDQQIVPENWIKRSTSPISKDLGHFAPRGAYGYLWWVSRPIAGTNMYFASGSGGQRVAVLPEADLVLVHVVNSYQFRNVDHQAFVKLVETILAAREGTAKGKPQLQAMNWPEITKPATTHLAPEVLRRYEGDYQHRRLGRFRVSAAENKLKLELRVGIYDMLPTGPDTFYIPDIDVPATFRETSEPSRKGQVDSIVDDNRIVTQIFLNY